jgi:hypothetical protein
MGEMTTQSTRGAAEQAKQAEQPMFNLQMSSVHGSTVELLNAVQRNVAGAAQALGSLSGAGFFCGCLLTLAGDKAPAGHWRVMAWNDSRCVSATHRALKAKWEATNLA